MFFRPLALACALVSTPLLAQSPGLRTVSPPPQPAGAIPLPVANPKSAAQPETWVDFGGGFSAVRNVSQPTLTPVLPAKGKGSGTAVIVAPGGAFLLLSMKSEGWDVAQKLADRGIAAFVLKYRLDPSAADLNIFSQQLAGVMTPLSSGTESPDALKPEADAVADGQAALRLVRSRAAEWGIDPRRVGFMGFSAGAMTTLGVTEADAPDARPDFIAPIYPPMSRVVVPADAPPMFVAIASDDPLFGSKGFGLIEAWQAAKKPVELHLYEKGGHGFAANHGTTSEHWFQELAWWMEARGLMTPVR